VDFPYPYSTFLWCLNNIPLLTFDVLSFECYFEHSSYFYGVYIISLLPIVILAIIGFVAVARHLIAPSVQANARDSFAALFLSSLMLPPVSRKLLSSLNCVYFPHSNESLLSDDTSISCNSDSYARFKVFAVMILVIYLSVPLVWAVGTLLTTRSTTERYSFLLPTTDVVASTPKFLKLTAKSPSAACYLF